MPGVSIGKNKLKDHGGLWQFRKSFIKFLKIFNKIDALCGDAGRAGNIRWAVHGFVQFHVTTFFEVDDVPVEPFGIGLAGFIDGA